MDHVLEHATPWIVGAASLEDLGSGEVATLVVAAFLTAIISAILGMAGGLTLLVIMLEFLPRPVVIPLHGAVQLASNLTRSYMQRAHIQWRLIGAYTLLLFPLGIVGTLVSLRAPDAAIGAGIGLFIVLATWSPRLLMLGTHPESVSVRRRFVLLGGLAGFLNPIIGATGPVIAPFFLNMGLTRFQVVGTKAASQAVGHFVKIGLFVLIGALISGGLLSRAFEPDGGFIRVAHGLLLLWLVPAVVLGTWVGTRLLNRVPERRFVPAYKGVLTLLALRLIWKSLAT